MPSRTIKTGNLTILLFTLTKKTTSLLLFVYGNKIAEVGDDFLKLFDGDHQTKTTKSRLNAILGEFGYTCGTKRENVFQKTKSGSLTTLNAKSNQIEVVPFVSGVYLTA